MKALQCYDTLLFLREKLLFGKLFYPNFRIESLAFYHKEEILKYIREFNKQVQIYLISS